MGVKELMRTITSDCEKCSVKEDLVKIAKERDGIEILVDFYCFRLLIHQIFHDYLLTTSGNKYLIIIGGEHSLFERYMSVFIKSLRKVKIELVWYIDCARGGSKVQWNQKFTWWRNRYMGEIKRIYQTLDICQGSDNVTVKDSDLCFPVLWDTMLRQVIAKNKCEVIYCEEDSDYEIASDFSKREKAYTILSNDSDFAIFQNTTFIPNAFFDLEKDLHLTSEDMLTWNAENSLPQLMVGVVSAQLVSKFLKFSSPMMMIDLGIVKGNNFSFQSVEKSKMHKTLGCDYKAMPYNLNFLAKMIAENKKDTLESNSHFGFFFKDTKGNQELIKAKKQSYDHYKLELQYEPVTRPKITQFIIDQIHAGKFTPDILSIHNRVYWRKLIAEKYLDNHPSIELVLSPLRVYVYKMCVQPMMLENLQHPENIANIVTEFGRDVERCPGPFFDDVDVKIPSSIKQTFRKVNMIRGEKVKENRKLFRFVMNHMLHEEETLSNLKTARDLSRPHRMGGFDDLVEDPIREDDYFELYSDQENGERYAYTLHILRYFLMLNWGKQNLNIDPRVFLALAATALREGDDTKYQTFVRLPTEDAVTIANWFLDVYRHAYEYVAAILQVTDNFPLPSEIFCGSTWLAFYACTDIEDEVAELDEAREDMAKVLSAHETQIEQLTGDYFNFTDVLIGFQQLSKKFDIGY